MAEIIRKKMVSKALSKQTVSGTILGILERHRIN